jgi:hypothetical protein
MFIIETSRTCGCVQNANSVVLPRFLLRVHMEEPQIFLVNFSIACANNILFRFI